MTTPGLRPARIGDATDLAAFVDMAGEGLPAYFWSQMAEIGQSPFEVGRARAQREEGAFTYRNATIAEIGGATAGAIVGYPLADPYETGDLAAVSEIVRPLIQLESLAPGHWYVNVLAVYPEYRRRGLGRLLLKHADEIGLASRTRGMAIIVASQNRGAAQLYEDCGYGFVARRPLVAHPGYRRGGDWLLLTKPHS